MLPHSKKILNVDRKFSKLDVARFDKELSPQARVEGFF